jgi:hypothetical protein
VTQKKPIRKKQQQVLMEFPPDLYNAAKAEIRAHGKTVRDWFIGQMEKLVLQGPTWRAFLKEQAGRTEAKQRGSLSKADSKA